MKTYKHRINGSTMTYKDGCMKIDNLVVEGHPNLDYWEEVVEKDYEVLSLKINNSLCFLQPNGRYAYKGTESSSSNLETCLAKGWKIYSVKRLSDGEVFTVGDRIAIPKGINDYFDKIKSAVIVRFEISDTIVAVLDCNIYVFLNKFEHVKEPNFTTEDEVDIFPGDRYYTVYTMEDTKEGLYKTWQVQGSFMAGMDNSSYVHKDVKYFSSKKAAEEYIMYNKPCLSLNDFLEAKKSVYLNFDQAEKVCDIYDYLKDIIKNRK